MERKNLSQQIADDIYRMISVTQELKPGEQLPGELLLADKLGVSRSTLREGIKLLVNQGILKVYRGKGTFVADNLGDFVGFGINDMDLKRSRVQDLFEARLLFEPKLAALASRRATIEEMADILEAGNSVEACIQNGQDRTEADQKFHRNIAIASHNRFMLQLVPIVHSAVSETILLNEKQDTLSEITLRDHAQLMYFLKNRDAAGAEAAMAIHLKNAINVLGFCTDDVEL